MEHTITLSRPSADTRLGIKVLSDAPDDPPVVKQLSGISEGSGLAVDDIVLSIDGTAVKNSKEAMACFVKAGTTVQLRIRRGTPAFERMQSGEGSQGVDVLAALEQPPRHATLREPKDAQPPQL